MSELTLKSGDSGNVASVDAKNRLSTFAVTEPESVSSSLEGETYFIGTPIVNLTSGSESFLLFIKNTDSADWVVDSVMISVGQSTGAAGADFSAVFKIGVTQGTLISSGTDIPALNMNLGSANQLTGEFKTGVEGSTATNGGSAPDLIIPSDSTEVIFSAGPIVIAKGTAVAIGIDPAAGNTSINVSIGATVYRNLV